jgi:hypothetical protein
MFDTDMGGKQLSFTLSEADNARFSSFDYESSGLPAHDVHDFAERYTAAWKSQDPSEVARHYTVDGRLTLNGGDSNVGRAALTSFTAGFMTAFPDMVLHFDRLEPDGDRLNYHWTFVGTNTDPGGTGKAVRFSGFESWLLAQDGLIAGSIGTFDADEYARQVEHGVES